MNKKLLYVLILMLLGCEWKNKDKKDSRQDAKTLSDSAMSTFMDRKLSPRPVPYDSVLSLLSQSIRQDSSYRPAWMNRASVFIETRNYEELRETMEVWVANYPSDIQARLLLGYAQRKTGDSLKAKRQFDRILRHHENELSSNPDSVEIHADIATVLAARYGRERAMAYIDSVREKHPMDTTLAITESAIRQGKESLLEPF